MFLPIDVPSPTTITNTTETLGCNVNVTWNKPTNNECPLIMYSVYYHQLQPQNTKASWDQVNVTDVVKTHYVLSLTCDTYFVIEMTAWNQLGQSGRSNPWTIKTGRPPRLPRLKIMSKLQDLVKKAEITFYYTINGICHNGNNGMCLSVKEEHERNKPRLVTVKRLPF